MSIEIKGINNLINRINKLSNIESEKAVIEVAKDLEKTIKEKASEFSENANEIKAFEPKKFGKSTYIDVGLKSSESDWDKIKGMWFNNYGYHPHGGKTYVDSHIMWFDEAVQAKEEEIKTKLKAKLKEEVKQAWKG